MNHLLTLNILKRWYTIQHLLSYNILGDWLLGINLLCAAKEYDQIYWVMYSGQSFKFKGLCVVVHPINWVMYSNPALKIIGLFVVVHPIYWDTSQTIQYIRIHHRQSNILGYIRGNPLFADNPIHWNALENNPILCDTLDTIQ